MRQAAAISVTRACAVGQAITIGCVVQPSEPAHRIRRAWPRSCKRCCEAGRSRQALNCQREMRAAVWCAEAAVCAGLSSYDCRARRRSNRAPEVDPCRIVATSAAAHVAECDHLLSAVSRACDLSAQPEQNTSLARQGVGQALAGSHARAASLRLASEACRILQGDECHDGQPRELCVQHGGRRA